jgi:endonuclease/exonuclease/phosphatase family metal-dependent hydrolase
MKLVQLNIWQGRLLRQALEFLQSERPDFICLQEIYSSNIDTPLYDFLRGYEKIQAAFPDYHGYFSGCYDMTMLDQMFKFGNATLGRYPLTKTETHFINGSYQSIKTLDEYVTNTRNLQRMVVQLEDGKSFCLINHHAYWEPNQIGSEVTVQMMTKVAEIIKASPQPLIFSGDLNVVPESPAMKPVQAQLRDLTQEYKLPTTLSELGKVPNVACDHICVSDGVQVNQFSASNTLVSDHKALVLEFDIV